MSTHVAWEALPTIPLWSRYPNNFGCGANQLLMGT
jgi:hypothetical protein